MFLKNFSCSFTKLKTNSQQIRNYKSNYFNTNPTVSIGRSVLVTKKVILAYSELKRILQGKLIIKRNNNIIITINI